MSNSQYSCSTVKAAQEAASFQKSVNEESGSDMPSLSAGQVLKRFASYYRPYAALFWLDLVCATVLAGIDLAFPQLLNFFTRDFFLGPVERTLSALVWILLAMVCMYLVRTACQYFITCWGHIMGARMEADMRLDLFTQYQRLSFSYYDKNNTGEMMSRLVTDLFDVSELAHHGPENLFICSLKIIGSFVLLFMVNVPLTLIMLAITLVMATYSFVTNLRKRKLFTENRRKMAEINSRSQDSLGGVRVVKSFGNEHIEVDKFGHSNKRFIATKEGAYFFIGSFHGMNSLFTGALYTATIVGGGYFLCMGQIEPTDLAIYALYIGIFLSPVETLINFTEQFQKGYAGFKRFAEIMSLEPEIKNKPQACDLQDAVKEDGYSIEYRSVGFAYREGVPVLHDLNLKIPAGKTVALVGPSGGGKTTSCALISRFYDVDAGAVLVGGVDVRDVTVESLRSAVGLVQQDVYLFNGTIRENIAYGRPDASEEDIIAAAQAANIHDTIMSFENGYDTLVGERGARLSGGQKQRISIARVFLKNPRILLLDEATSALDNESEHKVQESLARLSHNKTTLVIAHRLSTIRNADLIAVIDEGRVVEQGTHEELLALGGVYARYSAMQFGE